MKTVDLWVLPQHQTQNQDTDTLVNFHSGGLNRQKATFPKVAGGDNPMQKTERPIRFIENAIC
jgi:hypothetical protein